MCQIKLQHVKVNCHDRGSVLITTHMLTCWNTAYDCNIDLNILAYITPRMQCSVLGLVLVTFFINNITPKHKLIIIMFLQIIECYVHLAPLHLTLYRDYTVTLIRYVCTMQSWSHCCAANSLLLKGAALPQEQMDWVMCYVLVKHLKIKELSCIYWKWTDILYVCDIALHSRELWEFI